MKSKTTEPTFADALCRFGDRIDLYRLFNDFLDTVLHSVSLNPQDFMPADALPDNPYTMLPDLDLPVLFRRLSAEMQLRRYSIEGNDVLGEFYETCLPVQRKRQLFLPYPLCLRMTRRLVPVAGDTERKQFIDTSCGSGRLMTAAARMAGSRHDFYGIDTDPVCVKIAAVNLFLSGLEGEVLCIASHNCEQFICSYRIYAHPLGVQYITREQDAPLWQSLQPGMYEQAASFISLQNIPWTERQRA